MPSFWWAVPTNPAAIAKPVSGGQCTAYGTAKLHHTLESAVTEPPKQICIAHDDFYASLVGTTHDGKQFFITQPFVPYGHDFVVRYLFDEHGACHDVKIHDLGPRTTGEPPGNALHDNTDAITLMEQLLNELGDTEFGDITVCPFAYDAHDTVFGLVPQPPEDEDDDWSIIAEPGNYMAFYPPYDGEYDT